MSARADERAGALTPAQARVVRATLAGAEERASACYERWRALLDARADARTAAGERAPADARELALLREYALAVARVEGCALVADALDCPAAPASAPPRAPTLPAASG